MTINFTDHIQSQIFLLYIGIFFVFAGILNFQISNKSRLSLLLIFMGSIGMSLFVCLSDPFLHVWDEQVHAVIAKNLLKNPFKPMLMVDPVLPYDFKIWVGNHVWLHKQPLFLWQIALSFKLFGVNILSLRIPSILMTALLVFPIYRMGKIISSKQTGFIAAVLFTSSTFIYQLVSGRIATDHNDIAFLFYVTLSIWAWFEKEDSEKKYWILLIGLFAGLAILNKWMVGLLVYSSWGIIILSDGSKRKKISSYFEILISFIITITVALPWQLYILKNFPKESIYEFKLISKHFSEAIEGQVGDFFYHFNKIETLFGTDYQYVILISLIVFILSKTKINFKIAILNWILMAYLFFSIAATKMPAFTLIVAPLIYIVVAQSINSLLEKINKLKLRTRFKPLFVKIFGIVIISFMFIHFLNHRSLTLANSDFIKGELEKDYISTQVYKQLDNKFTEDDLVFYNARDFDKFKILFHTNYRSLKGIPTKKQLNIFEEHNIKVAIFDNNKLPNYILSDTTIAKIKSKIWQKKFSENIEVYY